MADAAAKITMFYEAPGKTAPTGWTETFYSATPGFSANIAAAQAYMAKRKNLLGFGALAQAVRVSNIPPNRQTQIYFFQGKEGTPAVFTANGDDFDPTQVDLLIRAEDAAGNKRQFWLAGLPDSQTDQLIEQGINAAFPNSPIFKQTMAAIVTNGWGLRVSNKPRAVPPVFSFSAIKTLTPIMVRNRKRGRPFFLFRGRRLA